MDTPLALVRDAIALQTFTDGEPAVVAVVAGTFLLGLGAVFFGYRSYQKSKVMADTETLPIESLSEGRFAVSGTVRPVDETLEAPYTEEECVRYSYTVSELMEKEGQRQGKSRREQREEITEYEWETRGRGDDTVPFYVEDDTGRVLVDVEDGASFTISSENRETIKESGNDGRLAGFIDVSDESRNARVEERQYKVSVLPPDEEVWVVGGVREPSEEDGEVDAVIGTDDESGIFTVTDKDREAFLRRRTLAGPVISLVGLATSAVMGYMLAADFVLA